MADKFNLIVETRHAPDNGHQENIHNLPPDLLAKRQIEYIDIVKDVVEPKDYNEATDPAKYLSVKTGRGHLKPDWREKVIGTEAPEGYTQLAMKTKIEAPVMCCYKLITVDFKVMGMQSKVEKFIQTTSRYQMLKLHRQVTKQGRNHLPTSISLFLPRSSAGSITMPTCRCHKFESSKSKRRRTWQKSWQKRYATATPAFALEYSKIKI